MHIKALHIKEYKNLINLTLSFDPQYEYRWGMEPEGNFDYFSAYEEGPIIEKWTRKSRVNQCPMGFYGKNIESIFAIVGENGSGKTNILSSVIENLDSKVADDKIKVIYSYETKSGEKISETPDCNIHSIIQLLPVSINSLVNFDLHPFLGVRDFSDLNEFIISQFKILSDCFELCFITTGNTQEYLKKELNKLSKVTFRIEKIFEFLKIDGDGYFTFDPRTDEITDDCFRRILSSIPELGRIFTGGIYFKSEGEEIRKIFKVLKENNLAGLWKFYNELEIKESFYKSFVFWSYFSEKINWSFSTGFINYLSILKRIYNHKKNANKKILLLIDEPDTHINPNLQREYIESIINIIEENSIRMNIQIILTTHSPIILSDLHPSSVIRLEKKQKGEITATNPETSTFGANIFQLYRDEFFIKDMIGEFAQKKIDQLIFSISEFNDDRESKKRIKSLRKKYKILGGIKSLKDELELKDVDYLNILKERINIVGDPYARQVLFSLLNDNNSKIEYYKKEIERLTRKNV